MLAEEYSRLRSHENENPDVARTQPVTARALETLIRLATAHARARLSKVTIGFVRNPIKTEYDRLKQRQNQRYRVQLAPSSRYSVIK